MIPQIDTSDISIVVLLTPQIDTCDTRVATGNLGPVATFVGPILGTACITLANEPGY